MWKRLCLGSSENLVRFSWCHLQGWQAWDVCLHGEKEGSKEFTSWLSLINSVSDVADSMWLEIMGLMYRYEAMVSGHTANHSQSDHPAFPWALDARSVSCSQCQPPDFDMQGLWLYSRVCWSCCGYSFKWESSGLLFLSCSCGQLNWLKPGQGPCRPVINESGEAHGVGFYSTRSSWP